MAAPGRSEALDLFKTMLVIGMVATHVLQLLSRSMPGWTTGFAEFINLITFSGFLLAMGIGLGLSSGRKRPWLQRLRPVLLLLFAAWISAFAFALLVDREPLTAELALDVLTMRRLFGWSEFLATFFVLYLLVALARPALMAVASHPLSLLLVSTLCLASTLLVMDQGWPLTATILGTTRFASFPLLPYLPWFLIGIQLGRSGARLTIWHGLAAVAATAWLTSILWQTGQLPQRFPPSIGWILGAALPLLLYFAVANAIATRWMLPSWVTLLGRHVLSVLLLSNLIIFGLRYHRGRPVVSVWTWLGVSLIILLIIAAGWLLWERGQGRRRPRPPQTQGEIDV